jgi:hypothetical protein
LSAMFAACSGGGDAEERYLCSVLWMRLGVIGGGG